MLRSYPFPPKTGWLLRLVAQQEEDVMQVVKELNPKTKAWRRLVEWKERRKERELVDQL